MTQQTAIIGGGVIGLSIAWELAQQGAAVTVYERDKIGQGTSWSASGILPAANFDTATDPIDQLRGLSHQQFPDWVATLGAASGIDAGLRKCGGWYLADTNGERAAMLGMAQYWSDLKIGCESVSVSELTAREPALADWAAQQRSATAWWVPDEYQIRPPRLLQALAKACESRGVQLNENRVVKRSENTDRKIQYSVAGEPIQADAIVVCAGAWTGLISSSPGLPTNLIPIRGQILLLKTDQPLLRSIANFGNRYIVCRDDGYTIVGSCEEEVGFTWGTTDSVIDSLFQFAIEKIPALATADRIRQWSGLRPMTFDGFPMIGRLPDSDNVYIAAGHYRSGIHLSPGTAISIANLILGKTPPLDLEPFRVTKQPYE